MPARSDAAMYRPTELPSTPSRQGILTDSSVDLSSSAEQERLLWLPPHLFAAFDVKPMNEQLEIAKNEREAQEKKRQFMEGKGQRPEPQLKSPPFIGLREKRRWLTTSKANICLA